MNLKAPWLKQYDGVPHTLEYPQGSMWDAVRKTAEKYPRNTAYSYMGKATSYREMAEKIRVCAKAFSAMGIGEGDRVTLCLPNLPQTVICFYALNVIGAVSNMIHPLSSENEIRFFLEESKSKAAVTLDTFAPRFLNTGVKSLRFVVITKAAEELGAAVNAAYSLLHPSPKASDACFISWKHFLKKAKTVKENVERKASSDEIASILYSGGTTGKTKGVLLTNMNFNAAALQTWAMCRCLVPGNKMLAVLPMFHGFGLGVCIHLMMIGGCEAILIPRFDAKSYAGLIRKKKPNYIAGVPTLFDSMLKSPSMENADLSSLLGVFSGGDALPLQLKEEFDRFLSSHGAKVQIREGFGMAECVTASCLTPYNRYKRGSIGLPFPDTFYKVVEPGTCRELPFGEVGELCIHGPSVMKGYQNSEKETAEALQIHEDGYLWLHTGDMGKIDEEGFVYYIQRIKRMIVSSGYSIYPSQLEADIRECELVRDCCVVGVPDPHRGQKVKAFVILKEKPKNEEKVKAVIFAHCAQRIAKYAMPREIVFVESFPRTKVGKIAYKELEKL